MNNGGGPACLRLRAVMNAEQRESLPAPPSGSTTTTPPALENWIKRHYPRSLAPADLADPAIHAAAARAFDKLEDLLGFELPAA